MRIFLAELGPTKAPASYHVYRRADYYAKLIFLPLKPIHCVILTLLLFNMELCHLFFIVVIMSIYGTVIHASSHFVSLTANGPSGYGVLTSGDTYGASLGLMSRTSAQKVSSTTSLVSKATSFIHNIIQLSSSQAVASVASNATTNSTLLNATTPRISSSNLTYLPANSTNLKPTSILADSEDEPNTRAVFAHFMVKFHD